MMPYVILTSGPGAGKKAKAPLGAAQIFSRRNSGIFQHEMISCMASLDGSGSTQAPNNCIGLHAGISVQLTQG